MAIAEILSQIDEQIALLRQVRALLSDEVATPGSVKPQLKPIVGARKRRNLSPEGRARIAAAVKARWAKQKRAG